VRLQLNARNQGSAARRARSIMRRGGLVVYPTDTVYGLGADATNEEAVNAVYLAKGRPSEKAISVAASDLDQIRQLAELDPRLGNVLSRILPGPYTVLLRPTGKLPHLSVSGKIGIRIPQHPFALMLCRDFPVTCTSANLSGRPSPRAASEVTVVADLIIDGGPCPLGLESTVLDFSSDRPRVLRRGSGDLGLIGQALLDSGLPGLGE